MDHVALNRTGAHDGDLDDEIVKRARFHPRVENNSQPRATGRR
jgi:hypothetical protein